jgi:hypothetical protein
MLGEEVCPGIWRWTAPHEEWKKDVASFLVARGSELVLIDPLLVEDQWGQLDEATAHRQLHVLLTIHWHARSAADVAARLSGTRVWAHSRNRAAVARRAPVTQPNSLDGLRRSLEPVLDLPVKVVLPSHGAPVLKGAKKELGRAIAGTSSPS